MSRQSQNVSSVASQYLAACAAQPSALTPTRPFSPPIMQWKDPGTANSSPEQSHVQARSTGNSPASSRRSRASLTPSRDAPTAESSSSSTLPFRGRSAFFPSASSHVSGGKHMDDTSLTQTNSSLTSSRRTPSSRSTSNPAAVGLDNSSIDTERISSRSSTPPLVEEEDDDDERRDMTSSSSNANWRRRLEGTASRPISAGAESGEDGSWIKKKAQPRKLGSSPPRSRTPPRPLTMETLKQRVHPDPATAPTEVMMNLSSAQYRRSSDQMTTVSGAPTEVITNRTSDKRHVDETDTRDMVPVSAQHEQGPSPAKRWPPVNASPSRETSTQRPVPVYPRKPVEISSLISASSNDDSVLTPSPVAHLPVGRLGQHVSNEPAQRIGGGDESRASSGSFQTKSLTSSVGVETGGNQVNKPPEALKNVFAGAENAVKGDAIRKSVQDRYGFGALKMLEEPEDGEEPPPPVTTPRHSPTPEGGGTTKLLNVPLSTIDGEPYVPVDKASQANNPFLVRYDGRASPPSERRIHEVTSAQSTTSSGGWTPAPLSSASGIDSADFAESPKRSTSRGVQPVFSPDRVDIDEQSPLARWSSGISPVIPLLDSNEPPQIRRVTTAGADSLNGVPEELTSTSRTSATHTLSTGTARRAALQRRKPSSLLHREARNHLEKSKAITHIDDQHDGRDHPVASGSPGRTSSSSPFSGGTGSMTASDKGSPNEQSQKPKRAWPISIAVPTSPAEAADERGSNATRHASPTSSTLPVGDSQEFVPSVPNGAVFEEKIEAPSMLSESPVFPKAATESGSVINSEINSMTHRQLLVMAAHLAATADDVAPAERYARRSVIGATRVDMDDGSGGDVRSLRSAFDSSLGSSDYGEAEDDNTAGSISVESKRSMYQSQGQNEQESTGAGVPTAVKKMRAMFESHKTESEKRNTFSENNHVKDAFAVFEKKGSQRVVHRAPKPSSSAMSLGHKNVSGAIGGGNHTEHDTVPLASSAGSKLKNVISVFEKKTRGDRVASTKVMSKSDSEQNIVATKSGQPLDRDGVATKEVARAAGSGSTNMWKAQMMTRSKPDMMSSANANNSKGDSERKKNDAEPPRSSPDKWRIQMNSGSNPAETPVQDYALEEEQKSKIKRMGATVKSESTSTSRPISPHDRWRSQMNRTTRSDKILSAQESMRTSTEQKELAMGSHPKSDSQSRAISPHDRWRSQMATTRNHDGPHSRAIASQPKPFSLRHSPPVEKSSTGGPGGPITRPISPYDQWRSQLKQKAVQTASLTRESSCTSPDVRHHRETPIATMNEPVASSSRPVSPHDRWRSQMMKRPGCSATPTQAKGDVDTAVSENMGRSMSPHNQWRTQMKTRSNESQVMAARGATETLTDSRDHGKDAVVTLSVTDRIKAIKELQSSEPDSQFTRSPRASPSWRKKQPLPAYSDPSSKETDIGLKVTPAKSPAGGKSDDGTPLTVGSTPWKESPRLVAPETSETPSHEFDERRGSTSSPLPHVLAAEDAPDSPYPSVRERISVFSGSPKRAPQPKSPKVHIPVKAAVQVDETSRQRAREGQHAMRREAGLNTEAAARPLPAASSHGILAMSKKPLKSGDRLRVEPAASRDSDYEDGVTLDLSIAEVSALTNPTCLRSKEDLADLSMGSSGDDTEDKSSVVDVTEGKGPSEASSSQMSEAAAPLIARMRFARSDDQAAAILASKGGPLNISTDSNRPQTSWDLDNVANSFPTRDSVSKRSAKFAPIDEWQPFQTVPWDEAPNPTDWRSPEDSFFTTHEGARKSSAYDSPSRSRASTPTRRNTSYAHSSSARGVIEQSRALVLAEPAEASDRGEPAGSLFLPSDTPGFFSGSAFHRTHTANHGSDQIDRVSSLSKQAALMQKLQSLKESRMRRHAAGSYRPDAHDGIELSGQTSSQAVSGKPQLLPRSSMNSGYVSKYMGRNREQHPFGDDDHSASTKSSTRFGGIKFDDLCLELD